MKSVKQDSVAPHDKDAEASALGCAFCDKRAAEIVFEELEKQDFYVPAYRLLFPVLAECFAAHATLDELDVCDALARASLLDDVGGRDAIGRLILNAPASANVELYTNIVRTKSEERAFWKLAIELSGKVEVSEKPDNMLDFVQTSVDAILNRRLKITADPEDLHELAVPIAKDALSGKPRDYIGLPCGIADGAIDRLISGFQPQHYMVFAARTSMGKSTLVRSIASGIHEQTPDAGVPLIVTTEMGKECIARAALAAAAGVHTQGLLKRNLVEFQRDAVTEVMQKKVLAGVHAVFACGKSVSQIRGIAKRHKHKHGLPVLIIDLASQLKGNGKDERERLSNISAQLADLKVELNTCIIACVQLSRAVFMNSDKRPEMHHLKGSGSWEEDADNVLFLHRPAYFGEADNRTEIIQAKDRDHGNVGSCFIEYRKGLGGYAKANADSE